MSSQYNFDSFMSNQKRLGTQNSVGTQNSICNETPIGNQASTANQITMEFGEVDFSNFDFGAMDFGDLSQFNLPGDESLGTGISGGVAGSVGIGVGIGSMDAGTGAGMFQNVSQTHAAPIPTPMIDPALFNKTNAVEDVVSGNTGLVNSANTTNLPNQNFSGVDDEFANFNFKIPIVENVNAGPQLTPTVPFSYNPVPILQNNKTGAPLTSHDMGSHKNGNIDLQLKQLLQQVAHLPSSMLPVSQTVAAAGSVASQSAIGTAAPYQSLSHVAPSTGRVPTGMTRASVSGRGRGGKARVAQGYLDPSSKEAWKKYFQEPADRLVGEEYNQLMDTEEGHIPASSFVTVPIPLHATEEERRRLVLHNQQVAAAKNANQKRRNCKSQQRVRQRGQDFINWLGDTKRDLDREIQKLSDEKDEWKRISIALGARETSFNGRRQAQYLRPGGKPVTVDLGVEVVDLTQLP